MSRFLLTVSPVPLEAAVSGFERLDVFQPIAILKTEPQLSDFKRVGLY